jgi:uncharacterized OB-fold protein
MGTVTEPSTGRILGWRDTIRLHYEYTAGLAGETFLRGLREGRLLASKCGRCGDLRVPPRMYCLECGARTRIDVQLMHLGWTAAVSRARVIITEGKEEKELENGDGTKTRGRSRRRSGAADDDDLRTTTFGYIRFAGVSGGLVHRLLTQGRRRAIEAGDIVGPVFVRPRDRKGSILDIDGFTLPRE